MCGFVCVCVCLGLNVYVWVCVCVGLSLSECVGLGLCVYGFEYVCVQVGLCVYPRMVLYLPSTDREVGVRHHTSLSGFDQVRLGCICLTSLSRCRVCLGAFILIAYDVLIILLISYVSLIHYLCTF